MQGGLQFGRMLHLPDPLHPFAVHFPAALLLLGCAMILLSLLWPQRSLLRLAALTMVLGALGALWAHRTGVAAAAEVRFVSESAAAAVQEHKNISDLMLWVSWLVAVAALASVLGARIRGVGFAARVVSVGGAVLLVWTMQATLHTGSQLTHKYFFGPNAPKPLPGTEDVVRLQVE